MSNSDVKITDEEWEYSRNGINDSKTWKNSKGMAINITCPKACYRIAELYYAEMWEETEAIAKLMVAAPKMAKALEAIAPLLAGDSNALEGWENEIDLVFDALQTLHDGK